MDFLIFFLVLGGLLGLAAAWVEHKVNGEPMKWKSAVILGAIFNVFGVLFVVFRSSLHYNSKRRQSQELQDRVNAKYLSEHGAGIDPHGGQPTR